MFERPTSAHGVILALVFFFLAAAFSGDEPFSVAATPNGPAEFDAARSYEHLKKLVDIGPRPAGSEAIKKTQQYISRELKSYGLKLIEDNFQADTTRGPVAMKNIIAELPGQRSDIVMISGHYDTKLQAGFIGANDGGSSTAAVLEMARVLAETKLEYTLWLALFDGEEAFVDWSANNGMDNTYGSRHMVSKLTSDGALKRVKAMVLVDMIGDKNLDLLRDAESTPWLLNVIWKTARRLGHSQHFLEAEGGYSDDHIPFKDAGVPVVDLIDFNYGPSNEYWHTTQDTLDKVSGESLKVVGDVVIASLPEIFKQLNNQNGKH
jgi:Zn-dependent M28 family amino/carboxypeptidase